MPVFIAKVKLVSGTENDYDRLSDELRQKSFRSANSGELRANSFQMILLSCQQFSTPCLKLVLQFQLPLPELERNSVLPYGN